MNHYPLSLSRILDAFDMFERPRHQINALPRLYTEEPTWSEDETMYELKTVTPGMDKGDIDIEIQEGILKLSTFYSEEEKAEDNGEKDIKRQIRSSHRWRLPKDADESKINATLSKGVLKIKIDKIPRPEANKIEIIEIE